MFREDVDKDGVSSNSRFASSIGVNVKFFACFDRTLVKTGDVADTSRTEICGRSASK